jgi:hypothetical protein
MCIFLLAAGLSLLSDSDNRAARIGPVVLFIYLFTIAYSLGEGPVAFQYSAEVFPTIQREQGMAWAVCINNTFGKCPRSSGTPWHWGGITAISFHAWQTRSDSPFPFF